MDRGVRAAFVLAAWLGFWLLALTLTHIPIKTSGAIRFQHADKVAHLSLYFVIAYLGGLRLYIRPMGPSLALLLGWACVYLVYGAVDEITQPLTGRDCDIVDWVFDALGVGLATVWLWGGFVPKAIKGPRGA